MARGTSVSVSAARWLVGVIASIVLCFTFASAIGEHLGIPAEQQARTFQPYVQLGHSAAGIGLGLATVDRLVRAHSGSLGVVSAPGQGSRFWFEIPKAASAVADVEHSRSLGRSVAPVV